MTSRLTSRSVNTYDGKIAGLYDMEETLGRGHFAVVKLARHVFTGEKVAVKVIDKTKLDEVSKAHLVQEVRCTKLVQHPNVVRLYEVIDTQTKLYLILELGDGGDMYDYIMRHENKGLDEEQARKYFQQIVHAISYCHRLHVVHRDLKPENVVFFEKMGMVKLTDFGFSNRFNPGQKLETSCGSLAYSAPEILLGDSYDAPAVDVWSLGVILYMLACGRAPFQEANDSETLTMIMDCKYVIPSHVTAGCKSLIARMLVRDPEKRATLEEISNDPWLLGTGTIIQLGDFLPLVSKEHLSEEDHSLIIQKMVNGSIANKEDILDALDRNEYNHITATYFLLAERKLAAQRQEQAQMINRGEFQPDLSPLSPCLPLPAISEVLPSFNIQGEITNNQSNIQADEEGHLMIPGQLDNSRLRKCSIVTEEDEEGSESDGSRFSLSTMRNIKPMILELKPVEELQPPAPFPTTSKLGLRRRGSGHTSPSTTPESECKGRPPMSPTSMSSPSSPSPPAPASPATGKAPPPASRRLHTVQSSPQLTLKEIFEEGEWDAIPHQKHTSEAVSPAVLRRFEQRRKKSAKVRTASCSSSDASDDDSERKKHKNKFKGASGGAPRITMTRRDSYDDSSDSQEQGGGSKSSGSGRLEWLATGRNQQQQNNGGRNGGTGRAGGQLGRRHSVSPFREKVMETHLRESQSLNRISEIDQLEESSTSTLQIPTAVTPSKTFQPGRLPRIISQSDCSGEEEKENEQTPVLTVEAVNVYVNGGPHGCGKDKGRKAKTKSKFSKYFEFRKAKFTFPSLKSRLYKAHSCGSLKESQQSRGVSADINQNSNDEDSKSTPTAPPTTPTANGRPLSTVSATSNGVLQLEGVSKRCSLC